ncbi:rab-GTPase-TBC domain-containing protein [Gongronella butleri]|nr:rab-GTPase-TBC domain-containing protein [Gongronella butleri]
MDSTSYKERVKYFVATLSAMGDDETHSSPVIDMKLFREACFKGIPDEGSCHATAWKVLLGYLPPDKRQWQKTLHDQRLSYYTLVKEMLETPSEKPTNEDDHPLSATPGSKWATYIQENSVLEQIDKDVRRTLPDFAFFQQRVATNSLNPLSVPPPMPALSNSPGVVVDDPLDAGDVVDAKTSAMRRLSFGLIGGRPRSSSNASRKSNKTTTTTNNMNGNRSRSNSRSSARSFSSAKDVSSPRSIVRKLSSAFSLSNPTLVKPTKMLTPICPLIPHRRSLFKRIPAQDDHDDTENHEKGEKHENRDSAKGDDVQDYHWEVIERLLFMYAKLNPGVGYVQGMNELLAPIYYLFANDKQPQHAATAFDVAAHAYAEADAFFVFSALMADVRDHFVRSLDQDGLGIHATMLRLQQRLAWYDRPLWRDLQRKQVKEPYYAFRWITVLFTQEWDLPDVIRLWDSLLAERCPQQDTPFEFLLDFAVAMLLYPPAPLGGRLCRQCQTAAELPHPRYPVCAAHGDQGS